MQTESTSKLGTQLHGACLGGASRPLSAPFLFRTSGKGTDSAFPLEMEKYGGIALSPRNQSDIDQNTLKSLGTHAKVYTELFRTFLYSLSRPQAVGVTFPRVTTQKMQKVLGSHECLPADWSMLLLDQSQQRTHLSRFQTLKTNSAMIGPYRVTCYYPKGLLHFLSDHP